MRPVFQGRTVLITGAAGGLGGEIAMRFAMAGARVVLHHRSPGDGIAALAERIASEAGVAPDTVRCDLTDERDLERMFADSPTRVPTGRTVRPREIADACVFLCSPRRRVSPATSSWSTAASRRSQTTEARGIRPENLDCSPGVGGP